MKKDIDLDGYTPPTPNDHKLPFVLVLLAVLLAAGLMLAVLYNMLQQSGGTAVELQNQDEQLTEAQIEAFLEEAAVVEAEVLAQQGDTFEFVLVQNALERIELPAPVDTDTEDAASYETLKEMVVGASPEDVAADTVYSFPFDDRTYGDFINESEYQFTLYQMHDEMRQLVVHFNSIFNRPNLKQRIKDVQQIGDLEQALFNDATTAAVYPNVRSAEAFLVAGVLSNLHPEGTTEYTLRAENSAMRGVAYGHYGVSDVAASRLLADQYLKLFYEDNPDGLEKSVNDTEING